MFRNALRVSKKDVAGDRDPVIAVSLSKETPQGAQAAEWLGSTLLGCSLLYPHSRLVLELAEAPTENAELLMAVERHRNQVEARGGSLRIEFPSA